MSDVTSFEVTGDWRHIVDDGMVDGDNLPDEVPLTGKVVFKPVYPTVATAGVPVTAYTLGPVTALVAGGVLTDLQGRPGVMLAGKVGEHAVRWSAETSLRFQEQKVDYPRVTFDLTEDVRLTGIITQVGPSLSPIVVDPRIEALAASVESVNLAVVEAEGHASTAAEQVPLAKAEADRAIGLAGAQDEHIAGTLEDPTSATHAAFKAVGNATYVPTSTLPTLATKAEVADMTEGIITAEQALNFRLSANRDTPLSDGDVLLVYEARLFTDFSTDTIGQTPAGWVPDFVARQWQVADLAGTKVVRGPVPDPVGSRARAALRWEAADDALGRSTTVEAVMKFTAKPADADAAGPGFVFQGSGPGTSVNGIMVSAQPDSPRIQIRPYRSGAMAVLTSPAFTWTVGADHWLRARVEGPVVKVKAWLASDPEPGSWTGQLTIDEANMPSTDTGWFGLWSFLNTTADVHAVGLAVGGDTAPTQAV